MGEQGTLTVWDVLAESGVCVEARLLWWLERELEDKTDHVSTTAPTPGATRQAGYP